MTTNQLRPARHFFDSHAYLLIGLRSGRKRHLRAQPGAMPAPIRQRSWEAAR